MARYVSMVANLIVFLVLCGIAGFCLYTQNVPGCALAVSAACLVAMFILFHVWYSFQRQKSVVARITVPKYCSTCAICLADFEQSDDLTQLPCLHAFHTDCFQRWMAKSGSCPHCRASFTNQASLENNY